MSKQATTRFKNKGLEAVAAAGTSQEQQSAEGSGGKGRGRGRGKPSIKQQLRELQASMAKLHTHAAAADDGDDEEKQAHGLAAQQQQQGMFRGVPKPDTRQQGYNPVRAQQQFQPAEGPCNICGFPYGHKGRLCYCLDPSAASANWTGPSAVTKPEGLKSYVNSCVMRGLPMKLSNCTQQVLRLYPEFAPHVQQKVTEAIAQAGQQATRAAYLASNYLQYPGQQQIPPPPPPFNPVAQSSIQQTLKMMHCCTMIIHLHLCTHLLVHVLLVKVYGRQGPRVSPQLLGIYQLTTTAVLCKSQV